LVPLLQFAITCSGEVGVYDLGQEVMKEVAKPLKSMTQQRAQKLGKVVAAASFKAAQGLMDKKPPKARDAREVVAVLGTFELIPDPNQPVEENRDASRPASHQSESHPISPSAKRDHRSAATRVSKQDSKNATQPTQPKLNDLGESGPFLMPVAATAQIQAAQKLLSQKIQDKEKRKYAEKYLQAIKTGRHQLRDATIKVLSQQLHEATKAQHILSMLDEKASGLLADPTVGADVAFRLGKNMVKMKIEGMRYGDGARYYSPQGESYSVAGCRRFLAKHTEKTMVAAQVKAISKLSKELDLAKLKLKKLQAQQIQIQKQKMNKPPSLGSSKEITEAKTREMLIDRTVAEQASRVRLLKKKLERAKNLLHKRKMEALKAASNYVKDANLDARELEVSRREQRLAARETELRAATVRLEKTAENLRRAKDTELVRDFPRLQEQLKVKEQQLDRREKRLHRKERSLALHTKVLQAKVKAFNRGVAKSIKRSVHTAGRTADMWHHQAKDQIKHEVRGFQDMLAKINKKYSSGYGSKMRQKVKHAVHTGLQNSQRIQKSMQAAARNVTKQARHKSRSDTDSENEIDAAKDAARGAISADRSKKSNARGSGSNASGSGSDSNARGSDSNDRSSTRSNGSGTGSGTGNDRQ